MAYGSKNTFRLKRAVQVEGGVRVATMTGNETLTRASSTYQWLDPDGARTITLPAEEVSDGLCFWIVNTADAAEAITVEDDATSTVVVIDQDEAAFFACDESAWKGTLTTRQDLDLNGRADGLILDADADTTISAPVDDQIDIEIAGADDFTFTANTFTALSGSSILTDTIDETTGAAGVTVDSVLLKDGGIVCTDGATLEVDTVDEATAATGVTVDGLLIKDAAIAPVVGGSAFIDLTACATGEGDVILADNLASAFEVREAANVYLTFDTTDDAERVTLGKLLTFPAPVVVDMADGAWALVLAAAGASESQLTSNVVYVDANSPITGTEDLTLPAEASSIGLQLTIVNTGGEPVVVKDDGGGTVVTLADNTEMGIVVCDGTTWRGFIATTT